MSVAGYIKQINRSLMISYLVTPEEERIVEGRRIFCRTSLMKCCTEHHMFRRLADPSSKMIVYKQQWAAMAFSRMLKSTRTELFQ